jgi:hypothetical protein
LPPPTGWPLGLGRIETPQPDLAGRVVRGRHVLLDAEDAVACDEAPHAVHFAQGRAGVGGFGEHIQKLIQQLVGEGHGLRCGGDGHEESLGFAIARSALNSDDPITWEL